MKQRGKIKITVGVASLALLLILGASIVIGFWAGSHHFAWSVWALVLAAFSTLTLAGVTAYLAASTSQDVRASQQMAAAAREANELAQSEIDRRPRLTLLTDDQKLFSRAEVENELTVRLLVANAPGMRAARGARVLVDRCIAPDGEVITFGSPALGWAGAAARAHDEAVVIFSGAVRVLDLGTLIRRRITKPGGTAGFAALPAQDANEKKKQEPWELKIGLPLVGDLRDRREHVGAGTTIRVVVGSDESDAAAYDVLIRWKKDAANTETLLHSLSVVVTPVAETHGNNSEAS